jgi:hypothetical protein
MIKVMNIPETEDMVGVVNVEGGKAGTWDAGDRVGISAVGLG